MERACCFSCHSLLVEQVDTAVDLDPETALSLTGDERTAKDFTQRLAVCPVCQKQHTVIRRVSEWELVKLLDGGYHPRSKGQMGLLTHVESENILKLGDKYAIRTTVIRIE